MKTTKGSITIPEYVTAEEVRRVCREIGISDWTAKQKAEVSMEEAEVVLGIVDVSDINIPLEDFRRGLEVELEHGIEFDDANVTNNHPLLTGKIVLAHLKESMDYYKLLEVAELEGDLQKAILSKDMKKVQDKYRKLAAARIALNEAFSDEFR